MIAKELANAVRDFARGADAQTLRETVDFLAEAMEQPDADARVEDAFSRDLDFGTGGLRGIMGPGPNRMNRMTLARATQGFANYIRGAAVDNPSVCIAYDSRRRSREFAEVAAGVLAGNGVRALMFEDVRATPILSFAVRHEGATGGIVVTASHNPKEYNGYKVYWRDGAQVIPPQDRGIIAEVRQVEGGDAIRQMEFGEGLKSGMIRLLGHEIDEAYLTAIDVQRCLRETATKHGGDLSIVYTPLHGTGVRSVPPALAAWGFTNVSLVREQAEPDGEFPTTPSPNPEERDALKLALELAREENADIVMATDPDADRIGVAVRHEGEMRLLTGNEMGALLVWWLCNGSVRGGTDPVNGLVVKSIVTTELIRAVAEAKNVAVEDVLTGFKWIARVMRLNEEAMSEGKPGKKFLMGCEESYGYLVGDHARDKDAVVTACVTAELALWAKHNGKTLVDLLHELFTRHGVHVESQVSKTMKGVTGMQAMAEMMDALRADPPKEVAGIAVKEVLDVEKNIVREMTSGTTKEGPDLPASNVLIFRLMDGSVVVARPSGTEPKIKFYFMVVDREGIPFADAGVLSERLDACRAKEEALKADFNGKLEALSR